MSRIRCFAFACTLVLALGSSACFKPALSDLDARWSRVETEHFRVYTDLDPQRAHEQALELERIFHAFLDHGWVHNGQPPFILNVVLFSDPYELERYSGLDAIGFSRPNLLFEPWIVLAAPSHVEGLDTLRHELTHFIAHQAIPHQPVWFAEGIACYFQTARFVGPADFEIGSVPRDLHRELQRSGPLPVSQLWKPEPGVQRPRFYATAWALVHYLLTEHAEAFVAYQNGLVRGMSDEAAWQGAFRHLPREALDGALSLYLEAGLYEKSVVRVPHHPSRVVVNVLDRADRYALEGLLFKACVECGEAEQRRSQQSFALALRANPQQLQASAIRSIAQVAGDPRAVTDALQVANQHPDAWLSWAALSFAHVRAGTLGRANDPDPVAHLMRLAPRNPYTWLFSATQHAERRERDLALRHLARARRMAPTNVGLLASCAELLLQLGACDELRDVTRSLAELSHAGVPQSTQRSLVEWNARCTQAPDAGIVLKNGH